MPITVGVAMAVIGAALVGKKLYDDGKGDVKPDPEPTSVTTLGKNANDLGYERVPEGSDLQPGQVSVATNEDGKIVGEMTVTEGGTTVYQSTTGAVRTDDGPIDINVEADLPNKTPTTNGIKSFPAPKRPITSALADKRITALRRSGFTFRL